MTSTVDVQTGLGDATLDEAAAALSDAFADYPVEISFTADSLRRMCVADDVVLDACALARGGDGRLLGVGLAALRGDRGRVAAMGVVRDAHGRGIGRAVGEAVLDGLRSRGARRVVLEALTVNAPALALYERQLGFVRRRRLVGFTRAPGGTPIEAADWDRARSRGTETDSWQLPRVIEAVRSHTDLAFVPAVVPHHHPVAQLLRDAGFVETSIDQYELERRLSPE